MNHEIRHYCASIKEFISDLWQSLKEFSGGSFATLYPIREAAGIALLSPSLLASSNGVEEVKRRYCPNCGATLWVEWDLNNGVYYKCHKCDYKSFPDSKTRMDVALQMERGNCADLHLLFGG